MFNTTENNSSKSKYNLFHIFFIILILITSIIISNFSLLTSVFGASYNITQSRKIAKIEEFPLSYRDGLTYVKKFYPNAKFIYYDTGLDWNSDLLTPENQLRIGRNLIESNVDSYWKSKDESVYDMNTDTYREIEPGWCQVSKEGIQYYMDPRNFFNEKDIFMFLNLSFDDSQSQEGVQSILNNTFMDNCTIKDNSGNDATYASVLYDIGRTTKVSPYLLASRIRQEQGSGKSNMISGNYGSYSGYYNYFNIGAYGNSTITILNKGLNYAKTQGWDTPYKSILGGADILSANYVNSGKNTLYLQHFNMTANENNTVSYSMYMANIKAPYSEARIMSKSLTDNAAPYTFIIPVYKNMPECATCYSPDSVDTTDYIMCTLSDLSINDNNIKINDFSPYTFKYTISIPEALDMISLKMTLTDPKDTLTINSKNIIRANDSPVIEKSISINPGYNFILLTISSEKGMARNYVLKIVNNDGETHYHSDLVKFDDAQIELTKRYTVAQIKSSIDIVNGSVVVANDNNQIKSDDDYCVSSDKLVVKNINNQIIKKIPMLIYGDIDENGSIDDIDINLVKEHILEINTLNSKQLTFADLNKDDEITPSDIGLIIINSQREVGTKYDENITLYPNKYEESEDLSKTKVTINASQNIPCIIEGFLIYDENKIYTTNVTNSGQIHFILDGSNVVFENGLNYCEIAALPGVEKIDFSINIISSYNYATKNNMDINTDSLCINKQPIVTDDICCAGHNYEYSSNNDASVFKSETRTGICTRCGKLNTQIVHGTRLNLIKKININIPKIITDIDALPNATSTSNHVSKILTVWTNEKNEIYDAYSHKLKIEAGKNYKISQLILTPSNGYAYDEYTKIYVNNTLLDTRAVIFGGKAIYSDIGKFKYNIGA